LFAAVLITDPASSDIYVVANVNTYQPSKMAAIEGRWNDEDRLAKCCSHGRTWRTGATCSRSLCPPPLQPDRFRQSQCGETGLNKHPSGETGRRWSSRSSASGSWLDAGMVMLGLAWLGTYLNFKQRLERNRLLLWATF